ncbi:MAG: hypothetical protein K2Q20_15210, partial [Phycisphaerales bacterium]|nr:hypothetical protein [Phycisphaerales bacterium]
MHRTCERRLSGWLGKTALLVGWALGGAWAASASAQPVVAPPNDLCANAQVVTTPGVIAGTSIGASGVDLTPNGYDCGIEDTADVWYRVPGGALPRQFRLEAIMVDIGDFTPTPVVSAHTGCVDSGGQHIACFAQPALVSFRAGAGEDVYVRVSADDNRGGDFTLDLQWVDVTPQPGDSCDAPINITAGAQVTGSTVGYSGEAVTQCVGVLFDAVDVWYRLTVGPGQRGTYVIDTRGSLFDTTLAVFSACPTVRGEFQLACDDEIRGIRDLRNNPPDPTSQIGILLEEGVYLIRVAGQTGASGTYTLRVGQPTVPIAGDVCSTALPIAADTPTMGTTAGLTGFNIWPGGSGACANNDRTDAWYTFTPTRSGIYTITLDPSPGMLAGVVRVFDACGGRQLECVRSAGSLASASAQMNAGQAYPIRVAGDNSLEGAYRLTVQSPPVNDFCTGALPIPTVQSSPFLASVTGTTANSYAIASLGDRGRFDGVWYSFTAPSTGWYRFSTEGSANLDTLVFVSSGCPGELLASGNDMVASGTSLNRWARADVLLTGGETYFVEVAAGDNAVFLGTRAFVLSVTQIAAPPQVVNDTCGTAQMISGGFSGSVDARRATRDEDVPDCYFRGIPDALDDLSYGVWYVFDAVGNGVATFRETGQSRASLRVFTSPSGACGSFVNVFSRVSGADLCGTSQVSWDAADGVRYYVLVYASGSGDQPSNPYVVSLEFVAQAGSCCVGTACAVNTKAGCQSAGGTYLGDLATCVKPSGINTAQTVLADATIVDGFVVPAVTTIAVPVSGVAGVVNTVEVQVEIDHFKAGNL